MTNKSQGYRDVLGSDVPNDGMYLELHDPSDNVVACVFRSDESGQFEIHLGPASASPEAVDAFIARAKKRLTEVAGG